MTRRHFIAGLAGSLLAAGASAAQAQAQGAYPERPVRIIMPVPPGTALDVVMRLVAEQMAGILRQPVLVEPRPGAGGLLAAQAVAGAPADGYTLLGGAAGIFTILPGQKDKLPLDVGREFTHIGLVAGRGAMFVAVPPRLGVKTFAEFAALVRAKPGEIIVGTNGAGTLPHYAGLLLQKKGGLPITLVPYNQGGTPAIVSDVLGGRVHAIIEASFGLRGQLQSGDLQLIGVLADERDSDFAAVPTISETLPGLTAVGFMSLAASAQTPVAVVTRLNEALNQALASPPVRQRFAELGLPLSMVTPAQASAFVEQQSRLWLPLVRELEGR
ncbi:MAG: Bug family tripartite tricarboxylate transporter substrate binding protein [Aestuariivirga sp.]